jgi:tRNA C32,U32 (ribose-2'-O)-methylase TrmJ
MIINDNIANDNVDTKKDINSPFNKLQEAMHEYETLDYDSKKEYMRILTSWYMRQKDALMYAQSHIK